MTREYHEREFDDEVYEDSFYDDEEELEDDELDGDAIHYDEEENEDDEVKVHISFACEDCDYRWDDIVVKNRGILDEDDEDYEGICPMCGSMNVTQI